LEPAASVVWWEGAKQLYFLDNSDKLADAWATEAIGQIFLPSDDGEFMFVFGRLHDYFLENKNYRVLNNFYERMQLIEPDEAKWHAQAAMAIFLLGAEKEDVIKKIKKAIELDPSYKNEGEEFMRVLENNN
jgi:hypothetical protein